MAQLTPKEVGALAVFHLNVQSGDIVITKDCALDEIESTLNMIRLLNAGQR